MKNIFVMIRKEIKDTLKNKGVLIQFIIFPLMTLIMENAINMEGMQELFFTRLFSVMFIGMAPLNAMASIISEEKEKNTLRVLMMSGVKPWQYLVGTGVYVWLICMLGAAVMATGFDAKDIPVYLIVMGLGFMVSILVGACIGIYSKNQMNATSLYMPVFAMLAFMPMLSMFNDRIMKVSKYLYTQQLRTLLDTMSFDGMGGEGVIILSVNAAIAVALFFILFRKKGLE